MSDEFATAMQLLLAERPSLADVQQAAELLETASIQGHAEASERLALLDALGSMRPPNWDRALDFLALAAEQGSHSAQQQMLLLADNEVEPALPHRADREFWAGIRSRISLQTRVLPGQRESLSDSPRIRVIRQFATGAECRWLISLGRGQLAPAMVFDKTAGGHARHAARDNSFLALRIGEMSLLTEVIRNRISAATHLPVPLFEPSQLLHYELGQRFKPHHDFLDPAKSVYHESLRRFGQRIATFLIYLNAGYEGGETSFPSISLKYRAGEGDALFFANVMPDGTPDARTLHAGLPPTSGEKWVFSQWIRDRFPGQ